MTGKASNKKIVGGLLAAGSSQRMGKINKLLFEIKGVPMVRKVAIEMLSLMQDAYSRFIRTDSFKQFIDNVEKRKVNF